MQSPIKNGFKTAKFCITKNIINIIYPNIII